MPWPHRRHEQEEIEELEEDVEVLAEVVEEILERPGPCVAVAITFTPHRIERKSA